MPKYLKTANGGFAEEATVVGVTTSAANAGLIPELNANGQINPALINAAVTGAFKVPLLDANGRLDAATMPSGYGDDQNIVTATEALSAGDFVNIHSGGVRKADASTNKPAHGFVLASVASGQPATVMSEGTNTSVSGLTMGPVWLSTTTPGAAQSTPPSGSGKLMQPIGAAVSATAINFQQHIPTLLA